MLDGQPGRFFRFDAPSPAQHRVRHMLMFAACAVRTARFGVAPTFFLAAKELPVGSAREQEIRDRIIELFLSIPNEPRDKWPALLDEIDYGCALLGTDWSHAS